MSCSAPRRPFLAQLPDAPVWPAAPDAPRVRYLGELRGSDDIGAGKRSILGTVFFGPEAPARLVTPHAVVVDASGNRVAVADPNGPCVHVFDLEHHTYSRLDRLDGGSVALQAPTGVAWMGDHLIITDSKSGNVWLADTEGSARPWSEYTEHLNRPTSVTVDVWQNVFVCETGAHRIVWTDKRGDVFFTRSGAESDDLRFNYPSHIACDHDDRLAISDSLNFRVLVLGSDGRLLFEVGGKGDAPGNLALPKGVAFDADGNLWVVDAQFENVQAFDRQGRLLMAFGEEGHGPGQFWLPAGLCIDARNRMWIADTYNRRVQVFEILRAGSLGEAR